MNENNTVIKLDNVSKRFNVYSRNIDRIKGVLFNREPKEVKLALNNISMKIKKGERVILLGVADSGRSTLEKVISSVTLSSRGKIDTFGNKLNVMLDAKAGLDMEFSCRDNIFMKANIAELTKKEIEPYVDEILEFAEVKDFAELPLKRAPKGTASLLSLGVHLKKDADILVIDEVFGGGGNHVTTKCEERVTEYLAENSEKTAIIVSNRLPFAKKIATRAIILDKGTIVFDGDVVEACSLFKRINNRK